MALGEKPGILKTIVNKLKVLKVFSCRNI